MIDPPLVTSEELAAQDSLRIATEAIRDYCEWHIAPVVETTTRMPLLMGTLPTLQLVSLLSIVHLSDNTEVDLTEAFAYDNGVIEWSGCDERVLRNVAVTMSHGYEVCPPAIVGVIKSHMKRQALLGAGSVTTGPFQLSFPGGKENAGDFTQYERRILDRYKIPEFS